VSAQYSNNVGGLVGFSGYGTISDSHASGSVTGYSNVGGLVGNNQDLIERSYATGSVNGVQYVGGLVGYSAATAANAHVAGPDGNAGTADNYVSAITLTDGANNGKATNYQIPAIYGASSNSFPVTAAPLTPSPPLPTGRSLPLTTTLGPLPASSRTAPSSTARKPNRATAPPASPAGSPKPMCSKSSALP
jgi:hypothetical protein